MSLRPEQEQALAYVRKRGTESSLADIESRVAGTFAAIEAAVANIPPAVARQRPRPSAWSVQEIVDHLTVSDRLAVAQLAGLLAGSSSDEPIPAGLQSVAPLKIAWDDLQAEFRRVHQAILDLLASASDEIDLQATTVVEMVVKCANEDGTLDTVHWLQPFDWKAFAILLHAHNREHLAQVQRTLSSLSSQERGAG